MSNLLNFEALWLEFEKGGMVVVEFAVVVEVDKPFLVDSNPAGAVSSVAKGVVFAGGCTASWAGAAASKNVVEPDFCEGPHGLWSPLVPFPDQCAYLLLFCS